MAENSWEKLSKIISPALLEPEVVAYLRGTSSPVAVACSGGPDSIAAALVAKAIIGDQSSLTLLHFNHHLRGRAADKDAEFVRKFAQEIGANFRQGDWNTPNKKNELAAREARMKFLHQWEHEAIVFGHHADDAVESFLMRLARGSGPEGLCAPHAINRVGHHTHLRPLLPLRKAEIIAALKACKIKYRCDASNSGGDYLRNRIRNKLLPLWQKIETRDVVGGILKSQGELKKAISPVHKGNISTIFPFGDRTGPTTCPPFHFCPPAKIFTTLPIGTTLFLPFGASLSAQRTSALPLAELKKNTDPRSRVWTRDCREIFIRPWHAGERYRPMGTGSRKIKEILNEVCGDIPPELRAHWPVVVDENGNILWLPGARITQNAIISGEMTQTIELRFEFYPTC